MRYVEVAVGEPARARRGGPAAGCPGVSPTTSRTGRSSARSPGRSALRAAPPSGHRRRRAGRPAGLSHAAGQAGARRPAAGLGDWTSAGALRRGDLPRPAVRVPVLACSAGLRRRLEHAQRDGVWSPPRFRAAPSPTTNGPGPEPPPCLSPDQRACCQAILDAFRAGRPEAFLLHGVTGSGKTLVYLEAVAEVVAAGRQAIVLASEIGLTRGWWPASAADFRAGPRSCTAG